MRTMTRLLIVATFLVFSQVNSIAQVPAASNSVGDGDWNRNWIIHQQFDASGNVVGESKAFYDKSGKPLQSQVKVKYRKDASTVYTHVFASQSINDAYGRPVLSTLSAPIDYSEFIYKSDFVRYTGSTPYDYRHFDLHNPSGTETNRTDNPYGVGNTVQGTLGWYYSTNNTWEPYTATTDYPYSRQTFYKDGTGGVKKSGGVGETFRMGSGREGVGYVVPVVSELTHYKDVRNKYFTASEVGVLPADFKSLAIQSISRDANGKEVVVIQDKSGKVLMTGRPGTESDAISNTVELLPGFRYVFQGNAIGTNAKNLKLTGTGTIKLYESQTGGGTYTLVYTGTAAGYTSPSSLPYVYKIESDAMFTVSYDAAITSQPDYKVCTNCMATVNGESIRYFKLLSSGAVTITGGTGFTLYNMETEASMAFTSGNPLAAGYYKLVNTGTVPLSLTYGNRFMDVSYNFYNQLGQLVATIAAEGVKKLYGTGINSYATRASVPFITTYEYDVQGRLVKTTSPDAGASELVYRKDGRIRFSQNAEQKLTNRYSYTNYDQYGRAVESGEYLPDVSGGTAFNSDLTAGTNPMRDILENTSSTGGLGNGTKKDVSVIIYDVLNNSHGTGYVQDEFTLVGKVSVMQKYSSIVNNTPVAPNMTSATWYNYDDEGKVVWMIQGIKNADAAGLLVVKKTEYSYDNMNRLVKRVFQGGTGEAFVHYYEYDPSTMNLWKVYTNTEDNVSTRVLRATYSYYLHGGVKRVELTGSANAKLQGIDYTYTLYGTLKAINNSNKNADPGNDYGGSGFSTDAFGEVLDYYAGDYLNTRSGVAKFQPVDVSAIVGDNYTGQLKAASWFSHKPPISGLTDAPKTYVYQYDDRYQFKESTWGTPTFGSGATASFGSTNFNKETVKHPTTGGPGYDANGNIQYLSRTNGSGTLVDKFSYNYTTNTNKLQSVVNDASGSPVTYANYTYDALGQLTLEDNGGSNKKYIKYDVSGKVVLVAKDAAFTNKITEFVYNEAGSRVMKKSYNSSNQLISVTYYFGDVIYTQAVTGGTSFGPVEAKEYEMDGGSGRLGVRFKGSTDVYAYALTDHLGNTKAVIAQNGSTYIAKAYSEYYPYGMVIEEYQDGNVYRYGYQGKYAEKDGETGWNAFELRMYDSRIARWLTTDPKGQYSSPYVGMGNEPVNGVDPDGGFKTMFGAWFNNWWHNLGGDIVWNRSGEVTINTTDADGQMTTVYGAGGARRLGKRLEENRIFTRRLDYMVKKAIVAGVVQIPGAGTTIKQDANGQFYRSWNEAIELSAIDPIDLGVGAVYGLARVGLKAVGTSASTALIKRPPPAVIFDDALQYELYWQRYAPDFFIESKRLDFVRISGRTQRMEKSRVIYDDFGRQIYRVDLTDHMRPLNHSNPHLHQYTFGPNSDPLRGVETVHNFFK